MFLWFAGGAVLIVWFVFRSPAIDYRLIVLGALLPLAELPFGSPRVLHSLTGAAVALAVVMVITPRRRLVQRRLVAIPIGMLLHLLLDGVWTNTQAFWWPFAGFAWSDEKLPELARGPFDIVLELAGAAALWWCYRRFRLYEPERRARFLRTGRIDRDVALS